MFWGGVSLHLFGMSSMSEISMGITYKCENVGKDVIIISCNLLEGTCQIN